MGTQPLSLAQEKGENCWCCRETAVTGNEHGQFLIPQAFLVLLITQLPSRKVGEDKVIGQLPGEGGRNSRGVQREGRGVGLCLGGAAPNLTGSPGLRSPGKPSAQSSFMPAHFEI